MKAARYYSKGDVRIEEIDPPVPGKDQVLVEVEWCGICGTDMHEWLVGPVAISTKDRPHSLTGDYLPVTLGHEFCGRVKVAPEGGSFQVGQAVMVNPRLDCQSCPPCLEETPNVCRKWGFLGLHGAGGGGFSEFVAVDARKCYMLPESVSLADAALIEPLAVGRHAVNSAGLDDFSELTVLVIGGGPVGISVMHNLRAVGVGKIIVSEPTRTRQEQNKELADTVLNPLLVSIADKCRSLTESRGVDLVFDCAGIPAAMRAGFDALRTKGTYVNVAGWEGPFTVPFELWMTKELIIRTSLAYDDNDFRSVVEDFSAGKFKGAEKMVTGRIALKDLTSKGLDELVTKKDEHVKILATPKEALLS